MLPVKHYCLEGGWPGWCYSFIGVTSSRLKRTLCGVVDIFFQIAKDFVQWLKYMDSRPTNISISLNLSFFCLVQDESRAKGAR